MCAYDGKSATKTGAREIPREHFLGMEVLMLKGRRKKILSVVLCVVMVFTGIQLPQWSSSVRAADVDVEALDELPATGTLDKDSYKISSLASLKVLAARVNGTDGFESDGMEGKTFYLANDIAINEGTVSAGSNLENWPGIGCVDEDDAEVYFLGTFDGMGHTVSGLYINESIIECVGLFGCVGENAVVKNLNVTNAYVKGGGYAGIIAGYTEGASIKNCIASGTVEADNYCGGISSTANVSNCIVVNSSIKVNENSAGGICSFSSKCDYCVVYETSVVSGNAGSTSIIYNNASGYASSGCTIKDTGGSTISIDTDKIKVYSLTEFKDGTVRDAINAELSGDTSYADIEWTQNAGVDNYPVPSTKQPEWTNTDVDENYSFSGGNGSKSNPYLISTDYDLAMLSKNVNNGNNYYNKCFKMTQDIDLKAQLLCGNAYGSNINKLPYCETTEYLWEPIGKDGKYFNGTFDGDGHTISNLCVNSTEQYQGLFGVTQNATIKNVNISSFFVSGSKYVGAIVGCTMGNDVIENCNTLKSLASVACVVSTAGYTGGLVGAGLGTYPSVTKCTNNALVFSNGDSVGGISGGANAENCINNGNVKSITGGDSSDVGGIIGSGTAAACENTGSVQGSMDNVGGIAGTSATVTECCNTGNVSGNYNVGGIGGKSCTISKCYTTSNVSGNSESTGVIQGYTTGSVSDSYCVYGSTLCTYNVCGKYSVGTQEASNIYSSSFDDMYSGKLAYELWKNYPDSQWGQAELGVSKHPVPLSCNSDAKRVCKLTCYGEDGTTEYKSSYELLGTKVTLDSNINWVGVNGSTVENGVVTVDDVDTAVKMIVPDGDEQIAVLSIEAVIFENVKEGYANDVSMNVKVSNTGNAEAVINSVKTSGNIFDITYENNITVAAGKSDSSIIVKLAKGQKAGSYKEIITITYNDSSVAKAEISATVKPGDSEDVTKEETTEEQETTKPQETTKEQNTTTKESTTTESTTTGQNVTTKPQATTTQKETTKSQETTKEQETTKPQETTTKQPVTTEKETTKGETTKESVTTTQKETTKPQETTTKQPVTTERETNGKEETTAAAKTQRISVAASTFNKIYGDKTFSLKAKTSGKGCKLTYSSSSKSIATVSSKGVVKINGCGIAKITITAKGTGYKKATKTVTVKVSPKQEKLSSVTAKKRVVTIKWKKDSKVSGYYVQYSTSPKFTKKTTKTVVVSKSAIVSQNITMKKKGKYYVRICGYKKSGKVKLLGKYSKVKAIRIK